MHSAASRLASARAAAGKPALAWPSASPLTFSASSSADLGAVDVKLNINHDGRVTMVVSADRSDTLNLLKQDASSLTQALRDAGLPYLVGEIDSDEHWAQRLSGGEQQMLAVGRSLMGNPDYILVDEPTEGLAPLLRKEVRDMLEGISQTGVSILLVEHNLKVAMSLAQRVYVMKKGCVAFSGTVAELAAPWPRG